MTAGSAASRRVLARTPVAPLPASSPTRPTGITGRMSAPPETSSPGVCSFRLPQMCGFRLPLTRVLCAPGFPPTDAMADRRMRCRHRLTVHPDLLSQASRHSGLRVGERDRFRADAALPTPHPTLRIDQRDRMRSPGQIVPRPIARRPHTPGPPTAATAAVAPASSALDPDRHPAVNGLAVTLGRHDPEPRQPQNPRTIPLRSHRSSLVVCTSREDGTGWSGVHGIALRTRPPSRPPQERGPRRRPGPQRKCVYSNRRRASITYPIALGSRVCAVVLQLWPTAAGNLKRS